MKSKGAHIMPIDKEQFLKQFSQQALDERISLFLGAGGSCDAGYPNWADLFLPLAKELGISTNESTDYYKLAQYYSNSFGKAELRKRINERINRNEYESRLLEELVDVGFSNVWTTNFDNAMEFNYRKRGVLTNKIFRDSDFSNIDLNRRINIFKMNGDVSNLEGIVATQDDFEKYVDTHRVMLMFFKRELISSTFLFIGYSFTDHLVLDCLSEITRYLGGSSTYHYTILKNNFDDPYFKHFIADLEQRYNIRVLLVDEYKDILMLLLDLNEMIRNKRVFISGAYSSLNPSVESFSHNFSCSLTSMLLNSDYRIVNGIGRHFGTHLIGYANEYLAKQGIKNVDNHLIVKPFVGNDVSAPEKKKNLREKIISQCGSAIFVFGESQDPGTSGVMEEYDIAYNQHKTIIPISYPGMISEILWNRMRDNITQFPYLEGKIDKLIASQPVDLISSIIVQILDSVQESK